MTCKGGWLLPWHVQAPEQFVADQSFTSFLDISQPPASPDAMEAWTHVCIMEIMQYVGSGSASPFNNSTIPHAQWRSRHVKAPAQPIDSRNTIPKGPEIVIPQI